MRSGSFGPHRWRFEAWTTRGESVDARRGGDVSGRGVTGRWFQAASTSVKILRMAESRRTSFARGLGEDRRAAESPSSPDAAKADRRRAVGLSPNRGPRRGAAVAAGHTSGSSVGGDLRGCNRRRAREDGAQRLTGGASIPRCARWKRWRSARSRRSWIRYVRTASGWDCFQRSGRRAS